MTPEGTKPDATHQNPSSIRFHDYLDIWRSFRLHLEVIWTTSGGHLDYIWRSFRIHLEVMLTTSGSHVDYIWRSVGLHLEVM